MSASAALWCIATLGEAKKNKCRFYVVWHGIFGIAVIRWTAARHGSILPGASPASPRALRGGIPRRHRDTRARARARACNVRYIIWTRTINVV